ncbi:MAG TPA: hypothetical protein VGL84_06410 [Gaiellaceae bacterium]
MRTVAIVALAAAVTCGVALGAGTATAKAPPKAKTPLCALGQYSSKAKPCKANPEFGSTVCKAYDAQISALVGTPALGGPNRAGGSPELSCFFKIGGKIQQFSFSVFKDTGRPQDTTAKAAYAFELNEITSLAAKADPSCILNNVGSPVNAPVILRGVGDAAFTWDECADPSTPGIANVYALKGKVFYSVTATHPLVTLTAAQLLPFVKQLLAKYH